MTNETLRMQMLAGIITEGEYKAKLNEEGRTIRVQPNANTPKDIDLPVEKIERIDLKYDRDGSLRSCMINTYGIVYWKDAAQTISTILDDNLPSDYPTIEKLKRAISEYDRNFTDRELAPLKQALEAKGIKFSIETGR
jgi:hypothetical protein